MNARHVSNIHIYYNPVTYCETDICSYVEENTMRLPVAIYIFLQVNASETVSFQTDSQPVAAAASAARDRVNS
jgi:hypothetical protein